MKHGRSVPRAEVPDGPRLSRTGAGAVNATTGSRGGDAAVPPADERTRHELIAAAAYFLAERRGFAPGSELDDWLQAEAQIGARGERPGADG